MLRQLTRSYSKYQYSKLIVDFKEPNTYTIDNIKQNHPKYLFVLHTGIFKDSITVIPNNYDKIYSKIRKECDNILTKYEKTKPITTNYWLNDNSEELVQKLRDIVKKYPKVISKEKDFGIGQIDSNFDDIIHDLNKISRNYDKGEYNITDDITKMIYEEVYNDHEDYMKKSILRI